MGRGSYRVRGLPHRDFGGVIQGITFRLVDAVPSTVLEKWRNEFGETDDENSKRLLAARIAQYEDSGKGECLLGIESCALAMQEVLLLGHLKEYELFAWVVMPNHVHVLMRQGEEASLAMIVKGWKGSAARIVNEKCNRMGKLWAKGYFDRVIRDESHFWNSVRYIHENPVKAGLVAEAEDWRGSSCGLEMMTDLNRRVRGE